MYRRQGGSRFISNSTGASRVIITDKDTRPAQMNLEHNRHNLGQDENISVATLEWGSSVLTFDPPYDIILAADVVYIEEAYSALAQTLEDLSDLDSVILLCCKRRYERDDRFFKQVLDSGKFSHEVVKSWAGEVKVHQLKKRRTDN